MKKIIFLFLSGIALISCEKEVEYNTSAMQARINNSFWHASSLNATKNEAGLISLTGNSGQGSLTLHTSSGAKGAYVLGGVNQVNNVSYILTDGTQFTTGLTQAPVFKVTITSGGTGYSEATSVQTTGGTGTGLKVNIKVGAGGIISGVVVNAPGDGYRAGDIITILGGGGNAKITVQNVTDSNGEIVITENTGTTISGTFKFTAFDSETGDNIGCRDGVFYKVPLN